MGGYVRYRPRPCRLRDFPRVPTATNNGFREEFWTSRVPVDAPPSPPGGGCTKARHRWRLVAAVLRAARYHHGRPRAGAGVHDSRPAGVGQVGPRVVASLETPGLLSPRRGLWALLPHSGSWPERGRDPRAGVPGQRLPRSRGLDPASFFLLGLEEGFFWSFYYTRLLLETFPGSLIVVGRINWLRFCFKSRPCF